MEVEIIGSDMGGTITGLDARGGCRAPDCSSLANQPTEFLVVTHYMRVYQD
jgi:hypothetical protein